MHNTIIIYIISCTSTYKGEQCDQTLLMAVLESHATVFVSQTHYRNDSRANNTFVCPKNK